MPRNVEGPWFRRSAGSWFCTVNGRAVSLRVRGEANRGAALVAWARLVGGSAPAPTTPLPVQAPSPPAGLTLGGLADQFLADAAGRLKPTTARIYRNDVRSLVRAVGAGRAAESLTPDDVARWVKGLRVNGTTRGMMLRSVSACLGWAVRRKLLAENVARGVPKPRGATRGRSAVLTPAVQAAVLAASTPHFRPVVRVLHGTGCRPGEAAALTAENTDLDQGVAVLEVHKSDRTGRPRLVVLPPAVCQLLRALGRQSGPLLRTARGNPWTGRSITQAMRRACARAGVRAIAYGYRHTFATDALLEGVPDATVAALLGHTGTAVLHRNYAHLTSRAGVLREAAGRVRS